MKKLIDLAAWNRREHFEFYSHFADPFFGVTVQVDFTGIRQASQAAGASFFLWSLHRILQAVNAVEAFRYRIDGGQVVCFDTIHVSTTIGRPDGTYGIGFFPYDPDREVFVRMAEKEIARVQALPGLCRDARAVRTDVILFSPVPWLAFTDMKHPAAFLPGDSAPRISTGRLVAAHDRWWLPVSISAHHGLMDGRHVADLITRMECDTVPAGICGERPCTISARGSLTDAGAADCGAEARNGSDASAKPAKDVEGYFPG